MIAAWLFLQQPNFVGQTGLGFWPRPGNVGYAIELVPRGHYTSFKFRLTLWRSIPLSRSMLGARVLYMSMSKLIFIFMFMISCSWLYKPLYTTPKNQQNSFHGNMVYQIMPAYSDEAHTITVKMLKPV
jgi:hypothetical protein